MLGGADRHASGYRPVRNLQWAILICLPLGLSLSGPACDMKPPGCITNIRRRLSTHGSAQIRELAGITGASVVTIRRDLSRMANEGLIRRLRGGGRLVEGRVPGLSFQTGVPE